MQNKRERERGLQFVKLKRDYIISLLCRVYVVRVGDEEQRVCDVQAP